MKHSHANVIETHNEYWWHTSTGARQQTVRRYQYKCLKLSVHCLYLYSRAQVAGPGPASALQLHLIKIE